MIHWLWQSSWSLMARGGVVMWPLLALSVLCLTLVLERLWFWIQAHRPAQMRRYDKLLHHLRLGEWDQARQLAEPDRTIYGRAALLLLEEKDDSDFVALASDAVESQRARIERFMGTLSTAITASPMLGILGTVGGLIAALSGLADKGGGGDPRAVGAGIAEALITTAGGLVLSLGVLFPYNALRVQIDRALSRIEVLAAAAARGMAKSKGRQP